MDTLMVAVCMGGATGGGGMEGISFPPVNKMEGIIPSNLWQKIAFSQLYRNNFIFDIGTFKIIWPKSAEKMIPSPPPPVKTSWRRPWPYDL